jgi:hypothetical protein
MILGQGMFVHQPDYTPLGIGLLFDGWQKDYVDAKVEVYKHYLARLAVRSLTSWREVWSEFLEQHLLQCDNKIPTHLFSANYVHVCDMAFRSCFFRSTSAQSGHKVGVADTRMPNQTPPPPPANSDSNLSILPSELSGLILPDKSPKDDSLCRFTIQTLFIVDCLKIQTG